MPETENLVLIIPDSLRRDFWPDLPGTTFDVVTAGTESPTCIPSLLTGRSPDQHGIKWFHDQPTQVPTVFDMAQEGYDVGYWDNPEDLLRRVLRAPSHRRLEDMEPPFIWVCRLMYTHHPYGVQWDELDDPSAVVKPEPASIREFPGASRDWETGKEYLDMMKSQDIDYISDFEVGVDKTVSFIDDIRNTLKEMGVYDDTFIITEADHGEAWGATGYDSCSHFIHTFQYCTHIVNVRGTVIDRDMEIDEPLRQQDTLSLWDEEWNGGRSGLSLIEGDADISAGDARERLKHLGYL